ncbi:hypothetical protein LCGC14_2157490, partial [marine sediment metagenome]
GKERYVNTETGWRKAVGVGGGLTGFRGTRFIIDDPHSTKTAESDAERATGREWFGETTPSRFNDPKKAVYVIIMQRLHMMDLAGMIAGLTGFDGMMIWDDSQPNGQPRKWLDVSKAKELLGWSAGTSLRDGIEETIAWYASRTEDADA